MNKLDKLKDIKELQDIQIDFMQYIIASGLIVLFIIFIVILIFFLKKSKRKLSKKELSKKYLKNIDFNTNDKKIAYDFTLHGANCLNEKFEDEYNTIVSKLEPYKYKKDIPKMPDDLKEDMKEYIKVRL